MPFDIPDNDVAFNANQSIIMSTDVDILTAGLNGVGVVSGCGVTAQGSPDMTVAIAAGTIRIASGLYIAVTGGNGTIGTADATNPRIDLVSASDAGVKTVTAGTAAASPKAAALPSGHVGLALVYVPAADTTIASNQITDKRVVLPTGFVGAEFATGSARVETDESTTSTTFADLATSGPAVTVTVGASGKALVSISARGYNSTVGVSVNFFGVDVSGASTVAATLAFGAGMFMPTSGGNGVRIGTTHLYTGLTPGSTTFKMQYAVTVGTGNFLAREIVVQPVV